MTDLTAEVNDVVRRTYGGAASRPSIADAAKAVDQATDSEVKARWLMALRAVGTASGHRGNGFDLQDVEALLAIKQWLDQIASGGTP